MKFKELTTKSEAEAKKLLEEMQSAAHDLALKIKLNEVKQHHKLKFIKKDIARIKTYLHSKIASK